MYNILTTFTVQTEWIMYASTTMVSVSFKKHYLLTLQCFPRCWGAFYSTHSSMKGLKRKFLQSGRGGWGRGEGTDKICLSKFAHGLTTAFYYIWGQLLINFKYHTTTSFCTIIHIKYTSVNIDNFPFHYIHSKKWRNVTK